MGLLAVGWFIENPLLVSRHGKRSHQHNVVQGRFFGLRDIVS
jgi:hypothetical protein